MAGMLFGGTTQKCKACEKTVYLVDQLTADSRVYHRSCFRCHHCKGTLKFSNYSSFEGVLYCKPHYDQLFKITGSLDKSFEGAPRSAKAERSINYENNGNSRFSSMFVGTQDKCLVCKKTVYPIEKVTIDGSSYHRTCFRCTHGGCVITPSNCVAHEGKLYCKHHHTQLFMAKGDFSQLGGDRHEEIKASVATGDFSQLGSDRHEEIKAPVATSGSANGAANDTTSSQLGGDRHEEIKAPVATSGSTNGSANDTTSSATSGTTNDTTNNDTTNGATNGATDGVEES